MTTPWQIQDLIGCCALLTAVLATPTPRAQALEVLGGPEPQPLLLADREADLTPVAASLGRMVFETSDDGKTTQRVVTATLIGPDLLLTRSHVFYDTRQRPHLQREGQRAKMRTSCEIQHETRDFRAVTCANMRFLPAFARNAADTGERAVRDCLHFAAYPGADGLAQEAVCRLARPALVPSPALAIGQTDPAEPALVPFMARRALDTGDERWDAVVGDECRLVEDRSLLRPGSFAGPSGNALRHYCAIWSGGSGAPVLQLDSTGQFRIVGVHLGERYAAKDIIRRIGERQFIAPHQFKGRNANVAVSGDRIGELIDALSALR